MFCSKILEEIDTSFLTKERPSSKRKIKISKKQQAALDDSKVVDQELPVKEDPKRRKTYKKSVKSVNTEKQDKVNLVAEAESEDALIDAEMLVKAKKKKVKSKVLLETAVLNKRGKSEENNQEQTKEETPKAVEVVVAKSVKKGRPRKQSIVVERVAPEQQEDKSYGNDVEQETSGEVVVKEIEVFVVKTGKRGRPRKYSRVIEKVIPEKEIEHQEQEKVEEVEEEVKEEEV